MTFKSNLFFKKYLNSVPEPPSLYDLALCANLGPEIVLRRVSVQVPPTLFFMSRQGFKLSCGCSYGPRHLGEHCSSRQKSARVEAP